MANESMKVDVLVQFLYPGIILQGDGYDEKGQKVIEKKVPITAELIDNLKARNIRVISYSREALKYKKKLSRSMISDTQLERAMNIINEVERILRNKTGVLPKLAIEELIQGFVRDIQGNQDAFLNLLDLFQYDDYAYTHAINVASLSLLIGMTLRLDNERLNMLGTAALLHDIGKTIMPKNLIYKEEGLSEKEWALLKTHTIQGYNILLGEKDFNLIIEKAILCHHEDYNGGGYPFGLNHEKLELFPQIISIADVFDAITSSRPYKKASPIDAAFNFIMEQSGKKFNPQISQVFLKNMIRKINEEPIYPVNSYLLLNTGEIGYVVGHRSSPFSVRPIINIFFNSKRPGDAPQKFLKCSQQVDLEGDYHRFVVKRIVDQGVVDKFNQIIRKIA